MDALTLVVDPASPLVAITPERLRATATRIGGAAGTPERTVAERFNVVITQETAQRPADAVLGQPDKIGVGLYHNEGSNIKARRLEFQAADGARSLKPSPFSIATEDYKFAYRILAFNRPKASPSAVDLVHFATSPKGQSVIADQGFVDLRLRPSPETDAPPLVLAALGEALHVKNIKSATRLSTNFRYASGADKFDIKALADLERVPEELARDYPNAKLVILGFTDSTGGSQINIPLSQKRAEGVAAALGKAKVVAKTAGLGDQLPVDSNETEDGKARNRRSEIWVVTLP
jgi:outer membrane protein OmpA-like peptidoglycan-associated protein